MPSKSARFHLIVFAVSSFLTGTAIVAVMSAAPASWLRQSLWLQVLLAPSFMGFMLAGGVHGDQPKWVSLAASSMVEGAVVTLVVWGVRRLLAGARAD